jgi:hypothetical protein
MSGQEFYFLTLLYGLKKLTDICNKISKNLSITSLKHLIQDNNYFQRKKEIINKLYESGDNDNYIKIINKAEKILGKEYETTPQSNALLLEPIFDKIFPKKKRFKE